MHITVEQGHRIAHRLQENIPGRVDFVTDLHAETPDSFRIGGWFLEPSNASAAHLLLAAVQILTEDGVTFDPFFLADCLTTQGQGSVLYFAGVPLSEPSH